MQRGVILISVLILLLLLSMSTLFIMQRSIVEQKMSYGLLQAYQNDSILSAGILDAFQAVKQQASHLPCWLEVLSPSPMWQSAAFWQSSSVCNGTLHGTNYHYVIEHYASLICIDYYRLTSHLLERSGQFVEAIVAVPRADLFRDKTSECFLETKLQRITMDPTIVSWYRLS